MKSRIITSIIGLVLCMALTAPIAAVAAQSSGKVGEPAVFNATGSGSSQTGDSNTNTNTGIGSSDASTDSTSDKQNKQTNQVLKKSVETIKGKVLDTSVINDGEHYVWVESMLVPATVLQDFLNQADYVQGAKYGTTNTNGITNKTIGLNEAQKDIMSKIVNGQIGETNLENGGTKSSNSNIVNFPINNGNIVGTWPAMQPNMDPDTLQKFIEFLLQKGYTVPGTSGEKWIDFEQSYDRYQFVKEYINSAAITDTVNVQHIIEYSVSNVTEKTLYKRQQVEYPGGGYFHWDISCLDAEDISAIGKKTSVRTPTGVLVTQFGTAGVYQITARENIARAYVSTLTYDIREYWILADTGQIIYSKVSNGSMGKTDDASGRLKDHNTAYYNYETEYNYGGGNESDVAGEVIYDTTHTVTADMLEGVFPATGVYSGVYNTVRIQ